MAKAAGGKKKKWSKGKTKEKTVNLVLFDKGTYDKLYKEVPGYKYISPSVLVDRLKITGTLARKALVELEEKGLIRAVSTHNSQLIYTHAKAAEAVEVVEEKKPEKKEKKGKK